MAVQWSASSGHYLVGLDVSMSPSSVSSSTSSVTLTWQVWVKNDPGWNVNDNIAVTLSGGASGTINYHKYGDDPVLIGTKTQTVSTSYEGWVSASVTARLTGAYSGGSPSVTRLASVPVRPAGTPSAPSSVSAKYVSDKQITVSWSRPSSATSSTNGWKSTQIQRRTAGSSNWVTVASLSGSGTSWSDTSVKTNAEYTYRVAGVNSSGTSSYSTSDKVQTTPAAPTSVTAKRNGPDIVVTWHDNSNTNARFDVMDAGTVVATGVTSPWTHAKVSGAQHTYQVRTVAPNGLKSAWSTSSNIVSVLSAPAAPQTLSPLAAPVGDPLTLTWVYNTVDTSSQTAFEISYSLDGGATWTSTGTVTSDAQAWDASALAATASTIRWQVRTQGAYQGTNPWSPWSYVQQTNLSHYPLVTLQSPDETIPSSSTTISWDFFQSDGHPQIGWVAFITDGDGNIVYRASGTDATSSVTTGPILTNGDDYDVGVRVQESSGLWSTLVSQHAHVAFAPPLAPTLDVDVHLDRGFIEVMASARSDGEAPETVAMIIERQIDDGPWVVLDPAAGMSSDLIDWTPTIGGVNRYRATATSALPSSASTIVEVDSVEAGIADATVILSGGPGFSSSIRFVSGTISDLKTGRERTLNVFAGRSRAVETSSVYVPRTVSVSARLLTASLDPADATRDSLQDMFELPGPHLLRDALGRRMFVSLSDVTVPSAFNGSISFTCTEIDPGTVEQRDAISAYTGARLIETTPGEYIIVGGQTLEASPGEFMWSEDGVSTLDGI